MQSMQAYHRIAQERCNTYILDDYKLQVCACNYVHADGCQLSVSIATAAIMHSVTPIFQE